MTDPDDKDVKGSTKESLSESAKEPPSGEPAERSAQHEDPAPPPRPPSPESEGGDQEGFLRQVIPELIRRTVYAGMAAVFSTEEGIRRITSEMKLPKEVANFIIQQAGNSKDELFRVVAKEIRGFLSTMNVSGELQKLLTSLSFEVKTEIRFIPNDEALGLKPNVRRKVTVKRDGKVVDSE
jgi:hypothetical protein